MSAMGGPPSTSGREYCDTMAFKVTPKYSSQLQIRNKWRAVLAKAQTRAGGGWEPDFSAEDMTDAKLHMLAMLIENAFLELPVLSAGSRTHNGNGISGTARPPLKLVVLESPDQAKNDSSHKNSSSQTVETSSTRASKDVRGSRSRSSSCGTSSSISSRRPQTPPHDLLPGCGGVVAGYSPQRNQIIFFRSAWAGPSPSLVAPVQTNGVYCLSKLEWLSHALAHEMVHCLVHTHCPNAAGLRSYLANGSHGSVFHRLNRHLFGHHGCTYRAGWRRF